MHHTHVRLLMHPTCQEQYLEWNGSIATRTVYVPYNTALGGTLPGSSLGGKSVVLQLRANFELFQTGFDRTVEVTHMGRRARMLDSSSWDMGLRYNMNTRVLELTDDSLAACNVSEIHSAAFNASSRVARERCVGPDMLRGTWNATSTQVAKTIIALPGARLSWVTCDVEHACANTPAWQ